jgi:hypothetical protein
MKIFIALFLLLSCNSYAASSKSGRLPQKSEKQHFPVRSLKKHKNLEEEELKRERLTRPRGPHKPHLENNGFESLGISKEK